jgi:hypothetical protein
MRNESINVRHKHVVRLVNKSSRIFIVSCQTRTRGEGADNKLCKPEFREISALCREGI